MLIAHEAPIAILDEVSAVTDYDYCLIHLCETHPEYYNFFKRSLQKGREVLLDNSIFELKEAFDPIKYAEYIKELKPTLYIAPDALEDVEKTISLFADFKRTNQILPGLCIGVVQGKTYQELVKCYKYMAAHADYVAISFDYSWYQQMGLATSEAPALAKLERMCTGRQRLIKTLLDDGIWRHDKPHHLLGGSLPLIEGQAYRYMPSIRSTDTSNPVTAGLLGHRYIKGIGLRHKPNVLMADMIADPVSEDQYADIMYNIEEFRKVWA